MTKSAKKRLCWNCEGSVSIAAETCPFCGVSVIPASLDSPVQNFAPSYRPGATQENTIPRSPYVSNEDKITPEEKEGQRNLKELEDSEISLDNFKSSLIAVVLLLTGSVFFLFGLALVLFSHNNVLTLQWDGSFWFIYSGLSIPLLFLGWRALLKFDEDK